MFIEGDRVRLPSGAGFKYAFEGFRIGGDPTPHGQLNTPMYRSFLANPQNDAYIQKGYIPYYQWTPTEPGDVVIRARIVFVIAPGLRTSSQIDWSAEGDARFPSAPLWSRSVELEHTISVAP